MSTPGTEPGTTRDAFLGGRLILEQPARGYRAGIDPVLLAASVPATPGQSVLELGCGVGAALFCLGARVGGLDLTGLELQGGPAELARRNARTNGIAADIRCGDLARMPAALRQRRFDHVIANPPYFDRRSGTASPRSARETAIGEAIPLNGWINHGAKRLVPRGLFTVIQKADRLPDLLAAMVPRLGSLRVRPVRPRPDRPAGLVIVQGTKGGRAPAVLLPDLILHAASGTDKSAGFSPVAQAILRDGAEIP
ncbi:tRNA1(Val) (adenine(37)-N6)-methyltransferase [Palleronia rufa]|uniref:tRNA1(Val) (adenine(37)-N6)-methyltransferase n=1 Tax=Palleronia rufa TaxID=1530186 RepID=UPI00056C6DBE|nr:methyltransferase domain-containing protein [Palleronia rufa]